MGGQGEAREDADRVRLGERLRAEIAQPRASDTEERELIFALMELAHRMGRDPYQGQPAAGALAATVGPLEQIWELGFDSSAWTGRPRHVLYHLPPNLAHPNDVVWVALGRAE